MRPMSMPFLATVVAPGGDVLVENIPVTTHIPVRPKDPTWTGSFVLPEFVSPLKAGDSIALRIPDGEDLPAVVAGMFLSEVYFRSASVPDEQYVLNTSQRRQDV
jgi:hypothetical protein